MLITSLLDTDVGMMPLAKVTDMRLHQTTLGHALGYAEFIVESAGQDQALSRINFVPYPSQMYQEILSLIFSPKPSRTDGGTEAWTGREASPGVPAGPVPAAGTSQGRRLKPRGAGSLGGLSASVSARPRRPNPVSSSCQPSGTAAADRQNAPARPGFGSDGTRREVPGERERR